MTLKANKSNRGRRRIVVAGTSFEDVDFNSLSIGAMCHILSVQWNSGNGVTFFLPRSWRCAAIMQVFFLHLTENLPFFGGEAEKLCCMIGMMAREFAENDRSRRAKKYAETVKRMGGGRINAKFSACPPA